MRSELLLVVVVACADPVVDVHPVMPKEGAMNPSCITAVELRANGKDFPTNTTDTERSCIEISGGTSYSSVREAIRGKFALDMPESGLASFELYGWSGPQPCEPRDDKYFSPNLLFYGSAHYFGQNEVAIPIVPNLDCTTEPVKIHMFDMLALVGGASCANATNVGTMAGAGLGTLVPKLTGRGIEFYGNQEGNNLVNNVAAFEGHTHTGTRSCLALDGGSQTGGSTGCAVGGTPVCAAPGEYEQAYVPDWALNEAFMMEQTLNANYPAVYLVSVWSPTKTTVTGATIAVDPNHARVVYVDPSGTKFSVRSDNATGPSGLALVYLDTLVSAKITVGTMTRTVTLGAPDDSLGAAMVVLE